MQRRLMGIEPMARMFGSVLNNVGVESGRWSGRRKRSAAWGFTDRTDADPLGTVSMRISYYQLGAAIALSLDLSLRERSNGAEPDDYATCGRYGKPGGSREGTSIVHIQSRMSKRRSRRQRRRRFCPRLPPATFRAASWPTTTSSAGRFFFDRVARPGGRRDGRIGGRSLDARATGISGSMART